MKESGRHNTYVLILYYFIKTINLADCSRQSSASFISHNVISHFTYVQCTVRYRPYYDNAIICVTEYYERN